ncbi:MAG: DUF2306 domain-containing protein [Myxococcaceae bacterium]|nr:DUF2306 domain-containing protein [Myxococcaceae bacterium]
MRGSWRLASGLIFLGFVPAIAGAVRLHEVASGAAVTEDNARYLAMPVPIALHIVAATLFALLGALQFVPSLRRGGWHRRAGRVLAACGVTTAVTGVWLTVAYPRVEPDGVAVVVMRLVVGAAMFASIVLGVAAARRRDIQTHERWLMRAYALGLGAGTQVFTHLPFLVLGKPGVAGRALAMGAGWLINVAVVEWVIRSSLRRRHEVDHLAVVAAVDAEVLSIERQHARLG